MITRVLTLVLFTVASLCAIAQSNATRQEILIKTTMGNIRVALYNETPRHRDNFIKLVREGFYDGILWHRVIKNFMIQTGDSTTRHAQPGDYVGLHAPDYTLPAEIVYPTFFHKRGALAAAREGDDSNPQRASSSSQFYIVYGKTYSTAALNDFQRTIRENTHGQYEMTDSIRSYYHKHGGTPHLDGQYTVFGEVTEGLDTVRRIQEAFTDDDDRPVDDIRIVQAVVIEPLSK